MSEHPDRYTAAESARRAVLLARGAAAITAGRSTDAVDRALDQLAERAVEREQAEAAAREKHRQRGVQQRADAKTASRR